MITNSALEFIEAFRVNRILVSSSKNQIITFNNCTDLPSYEEELSRKKDYFIIQLCNEFAKDASVSLHLAGYYKYELKRIAQYFVTTETLEVNHNHTYIQERNKTIRPEDLSAELQKQIQCFIQIQIAILHETIRLLENQDNSPFPFIWNRSVTDLTELCMELTSCRCLLPLYPDCPPNLFTRIAFHFLGVKLPVNLSAEKNKIINRHNSVSFLERLKSEFIQYIENKE